MHPQRSLVIQGSFPAGRPRVVLPTGRPGQPARPVAQPAGSSHVTPLDPTRLNLGGVGGSALPEAVQRKMEAFYKTDFSDVRVFMGPQASSIGALAFTLGSNIYFAPGQYNPQSVHGQQLLGHELAHVLQQRAGRVRNPQGSGVAVVQDPHLEAEADRLGRQAAAQPMMPVGGPALQRPGMVQAKVGGAQVGVRLVAPPPVAAWVQPKLPPAPPGGRALAPHVQAAVAACAQPKMPVTQPGVRLLAPHVQAAIAAGAQPKLSATQPGGRPLAPHVQAAVAASAQPKMPMAPPGGRPLAPHVQAAVAAGAQPKWSAAQPGGRSLAPQDRAASAHAVQAKRSPITTHIVQCLQDLTAAEWAGVATTLAAEVTNTVTGITTDLGKFYSGVGNHAEDNLIAALPDGLAAGNYNLLIVINRSPCSDISGSDKANGQRPCMERLIELQTNGIGGTHTFDLTVIYRHLYGHSNWERALNALAVRQGIASGIQFGHGEGYYDVGVTTLISQLEH